MVVVCLREVSTAALRTHNLAGVPVTQCRGVALRMSRTATTTEVKSGS